MLFQSNDFYVDLLEGKDKDIDGILEVYNSNDHFLVNHMDTNKVTRQWVHKELESMRKVGFYSCKIVDKRTDKIMGIIDFKLDEETYLSLLMIHRDYKGQGYGKLIFQEFEKYVKSSNSKCIRIDVVTSYDSWVYDFWFDNGFVKVEDVKLNWTGKILPAVTMKKYL